MFTVTDEAAVVLKDMLDDADDRPTGHTFRIDFDEAGRPGLAWDKPTNDDHQIQVEDEAVLLIGEEAWQVLDDVTMDVVDTAEGKRLRLSRQTDQTA